MKSFWAVIGVIICSILVAFGQLFWKLGSLSFELNLLSILLNFEFILGSAFYCLGILLLVSSLRHGQLSVLYPFLSLSYVWVPFIALFFLGESLNANNWIAAVLIIAGVVSISRGDSS